MEIFSRPRTVLIVDDDRGLLKLIERALQREGFTTATAMTGRDAFTWLSKNRADLVLLDLKLQDIEGKELIRELSQLPSMPPFIIITGQGDERVAVDMMKSGARDYLVKDVRFLQFVPEVVRNVMEQIETERRLAAAEERVNLVQHVIEQGFSAVLIASSDLPDPKVLYINPAFAEMTGVSSLQIVGQPLSKVGGLGAVQERLGKGIPEEGNFVDEVSSYLSSDGERWIEWRIGPVKDKTGRITNWLVILRDITERRRLENEILEINERVQRQIGQDLHDGLCQQLAGIELMSQVLEQKVSARSKSDGARVGEIAGHVRNAISQARLMARGLSPVVLESEGLMSGLKEMASNMEKIFGVTCAFECESPVLVNDHAAATHLFRIAQEAVSNAIRHGKAKSLVIALKREQKNLVLRITDNGTGFVSEPATAKGMGLRIMQSRAATVGGKLVVENLPRGGVSVTCTVALPDGSEQNDDERGRKKEKSKPQKTDSHR
jgi:PAS domain S-box-containing protein